MGFGYHDDYFNRPRLLTKPQSYGLILGLVLEFAVAGAMLWTGYENMRAANALNESNKIMVGVENGQIANPGNFKKSDPAREF